MPGLDAKPIIDLAIGLTAHANTAEVRSRIESATDFVFREDLGEGGGLLFVRTDGDVRSVHAHAVPANSDQWRNYVGFRDYLTEHPERRREYLELKRALAERFPNDRLSYAEAKNAYIQETLTVMRR